MRVEPTDQGGAISRRSCQELEELRGAVLAESANDARADLVEVDRGTRAIGHKPQPETRAALRSVILADRRRRSTGAVRGPGEDSPFHPHPPHSLVPFVRGVA
jgi:hypothetical protein